MTRARAAWLGAIGVGAGLRGARYFQLRGFWGDEAFLILNVLKLPLRQLLRGPLNVVPASQVSPPGFSLALRGLATSAGPTEWAMRLVPFACSLLTLLVVAWTARRAARGAEWAAAGVAFLWAIAEPLVYQSANVKQYSSDALLASAVVATLFANRSAAWRAAAISLPATVAVWCSMPLIFVVLGAFVGLALEARREGRIAAVAAWAVLPVASFAAMYFVSARGMYAPDLARFWADAFPPWDRPGRALAWPFVKIFALFNYPFKPVGFVLAIPAGWAVLLAGQRHAEGELAASRGMGETPMPRDETVTPEPLTTGGVPLSREPLGYASGPARALSLGLVVALVAPIAIAMFAAAVGKYPFEGARTTLYLLPAVFALCALGLARMGRLAAGVIAVAAVGGAISFAGEVRAPFGTRDVRPALAYVWAHRAPGEPVLVTPSSGSIVEVHWWGRGAADVRFFPGMTAARPEGAFWVVGCYDPQDKIKEKDVPFLATMGEWDEGTSASGRGWLARHYVALPAVGATRPAQ